MKAKKIAIIIALIPLFLTLVYAFTYNQPADNYVINETSGQIIFVPLNNTWLHFNSVQGLSTQQVITNLDGSNFNVSALSFAWCAWFNNTGDMFNSSGTRMTQQHIITSYPNTFPQTTLYYNFISNRTEFITRNTTSTITTIGATNSALRNVWNHVCISVNRTEGTNGIQHIYLNGVETGTPSNIATGRIINNLPTGNITIGCNLNAVPNNYNCFNGTIDEIRIYNRSLSQTDELQLYNLGRIYQ